MGANIRGKRSKTKPNKKLYLFCLIAVLAALGAGSMMARAALENEKSSSLRSVHVKDSEIENATLVIGSHLIHIDGLTSELYEAAMESANEFNQSQMYYKSELAGGTWFEISEATSIADITTSGKPVNKSVIEALEFTHKTGADGITKDLRTGQEVSVFDINNPYDLRVMEELEPLRIQYQILQDKAEKSDSDELYLEMIEDFFSQDITNDQTDECDTSLDGLKWYKDGLSPREKPALWAEKTEAIMVSVDAERRVISLTNLSGLLDLLEGDASGMGTSMQEKPKQEGDDEGDDEEEEPEMEPRYAIEVLDSDIIAAIGDCIQNVQASISAYEAKRMTDSGDTTSAKAEYRYSQDLIVRAREQDTEGCDRLMEMLCNLQNILDGVIANQDSELDTLTSDLVSAAFQKYVSDLRAGVSEDYKNAQSAGSSQAVLFQHLSNQKAATNADRLEYQTMLEAQFQRMDNTLAQSYVLQLIDGVPQLEQSVIADAAEAYLKETVAEHLAWLRKEYADLVKAASDSTDMSKLEQEKDDLEKQRRDALDNNDLAGANKLTAQMDAKQNDINNLADSLNAILNSPNSSEADKAKAKAGMGGNNTSALLSSMAEDLSSAIRDADGSASGADMANQLAALAAVAGLDPAAGEAALNQVQEALDNATGLDADTAAALAKGLADAKDALKDGAGRQLSADELTDLLNSILESLFGSSFDKASYAQQAAAMLAMEWYGENRNSSAALDLAASLAKQTAQSRNPYLYEKYKGQKEAYMSLQALGRVMGYRYIFDDEHDTVTLQKSKEYYLFMAAQKQYTMAGGNSGKLGAAPVLMNTLYLRGDDSSKIFDAKAEYIKKASYGVVGTAPVETLAKEIYDSLLEGGA